MEKQERAEDFFLDLVDKEASNLIGSWQGTLHLVADFSGDDWMIDHRLHFKMGTKRMYVVKDIEEEIVEPGRWEGAIEQGKMQFVQIKRALFDEQSRKLYDFIVRNQSHIGGNYLYLEKEVWRTLST